MMHLCLGAVAFMVGPFLLGFLLAKTARALRDRRMKRIMDGKE